MSIYAIYLPYTKYLNIMIKIFTSKLLSTFYFYNLVNNFCRKHKLFS